MPKHNGLSYVLLDFTGPGVEYRPIKQMTGAAEFAEDFFDGARAPLFNVIGGLNNGWRVAMTTLGYERGGRATTGYLGFEREFWELVETARKHGKQRRPAGPPAARLGLHPGPADEVQRPADAGPAGRGPGARPRGVDRQAVLERVLQAPRRGRGRHRGQPRRCIRPEGGGYPTRPCGRTTSWPAAPATIYAGTNEIQRNIIGERVLGLPKEPRVS